MTMIPPLNPLQWVSPAELPRPIPGMSALVVIPNVLGYLEYRGETVDGLRPLTRNEALVSFGSVALIAAEERALLHQQAQNQIARYAFKTKFPNKTPPAVLFNPLVFLNHLRASTPLVQPP